MSHLTQTHHKHGASKNELEAYCPLDWSMIKQLNALPELMLKDREILANKIDALAQKSDMKDEENERSIRTVVQQMEDHRANNNKRFDEVDEDIHSIQTDVNELKETTQKTSSLLDNLSKILKWVLGVFSSILLVVLGILLRALLLALL